MGLRLQPFEAHIPYLLQFKIDMNLYGMSHLLCRAVQFRGELPLQLRTQAPPGWRHELTQAPAHKAAHAAGSVTVRPQKS